MRGIVAAATSTVVALVAGWAAAGPAAGDTPPTPAPADAPPAAVESLAYPGSAQILATRGIALSRGDGGILLTDCGKAGSFQIKVRAITTPPNPDDAICFAAPGASGYLALSVPNAYRVSTYGRSVRASLSTDQKPTETVDVAMNDTAGIGESLDPKARAVVLELRVTGTSATPPTPQPTDPATAFTAKLNIGNGKRTCSAALVDRSWLLTAASCFTDTPNDLSTVTAGAPKDRTTVTLGRTDLTNTGTGAVADVVELAPRTDRDLVMARLATPVDGITPATLTASAAATGQNLRIPGYGRTATEWVPTKLHTTTHTVGAVAPTTVDTTPTDGQAPLCQGDAGAPILRDNGGRTELAAIASRSWQGGCLGTPATETRTGATSSRVDDLTTWIQQVRATAFGWKTQALVKGDSGLYQATRLYDGSWTAFQDVQTKAGTIGGVKAVAAAGINGDTHVLALGGDGHLHHTVRTAAGAWSSFGDLNKVVGDLGNITQVSASSIGADLHVVVLADGQVFHTVRRADGTWTGFGAVFGAAGPLNGVTSVAAAGTGGELQVAVTANGTIQHTVRRADGTWSAWGAVANVAGPIGTVTSVAMARQGDDMDLIAVTSTGAQFHTVCFADRTWQPFRPLTGVLGNVTGTSVSATPVNGDAQIAVTTTDNRVLTTARHADGTWAPVQALDLSSVPGNHTGTAITGTL
ncbi:trypsin-like serine protease [Kitasatospora sp. NPDC089509]|uniref:trypsin-like serine protease n=1 Tax=Kitasatospora sp. NPDC089509 TaxID=3364079 RepID=UPI00382D07A9